MDVQHAEHKVFTPAESSESRRGGPRRSGVPTGFPFSGEVRLLQNPLVPTPQDLFLPGIVLSALLSGMPRGAIDTPLTTMG